MNKLATIVPDEITQSQIKTELYHMVTESALELLENGQEATASNLMAIINKKIEEL